MLNRFKNSEFIKKIKESVNPRFNWLTFSNKNTLDKSTTDYLESITGAESMQTFSDEQELEAMVRNQLKEEFPNIENMKSYELLVDAVVHNMKKKQLQADDNLDIE